MSLDSELKPLVANLSRIGFFEYVASDEFENLLLEWDLDEDWDRAVQEAAEDEVEEGEEYLDEHYDNGFLILLEERYAYDDFEDLVVDLLIDYSEWFSKAFDLDKLIKSLRDLEFSQAAIRRLKNNVKKIQESKPVQKNNSVTKQPLDRRKVFIVHGHDHVSKLELEKFLKEDLNLKPVVLGDQITDSVETIISKLKRTTGDCYSAIILLTPDDEMVDNSKHARQNVLLELGYFLGRFTTLNEGKIVVLKKGDVVVPSDFQGVIYEKFHERVTETFHFLRKHFEDWLHKK